MLRFRPHHFLCALGYRGKGYSTQFTANMDGIVFGRLRAPVGQDMLIEVVELSDDICAPCPHRRGEGCDKQNRIAALDRRHAQRLGLRNGQRVGWQEMRARIRERVRSEDLDTLCQGCEWLGAGMCKEAVEALGRE